MMKKTSKKIMMLGLASVLVLNSTIPTYAMLGRAAKGLAPEAGAIAKTAAQRFAPKMPAIRTAAQRMVGAAKKSGATQTPRLSPFFNSFCQHPALMPRDGMALVMPHGTLPLGTVSCSGMAENLSEPLLRLCPRNLGKTLTARTAACNLVAADMLPTMARDVHIVNSVAHDVCKARGWSGSGALDSWLGTIDKKVLEAVQKDVEKNLETKGYLVTASESVVSSEQRVAQDVAAQLPEVPVAVCAVPKEMPAPSAPHVQTKALIPARVQETALSGVKETSVAPVTPQSQAIIIHPVYGKQKEISASSVQTGESLLNQVRKQQARDNQLFAMMQRDAQQNSAVQPREDVSKALIIYDAQQPKTVLEIARAQKTGVVPAKGLPKTDVVPARMQENAVTAAPRSNTPVVAAQDAKAASQAKAAEPFYSEDPYRLPLAQSRTQQMCDVIPRRGTLDGLGRVANALINAGSVGIAIAQATSSKPAVDAESKKEELKKDEKKSGWSTAAKVAGAAAAVGGAVALFCCAGPSADTTKTLMQSLQGLFDYAAKTGGK